MALVDEMSLIPSAKLFNDPCYQKLQEKWCASQFGIGYGKYINKCKIGVNDTNLRSYEQFLINQFTLLINLDKHSIIELKHKKRKCIAPDEAFVHLFKRSGNN